MALWDKIAARGNVEDRRGFAPVVGGISLTGVALLFLFSALTGGDPADLLNQLQDVQVQESPQLESRQFEGEDSYETFASTVLGSNNKMWSEVFAENDKVYNPPKLVLFRESTTSGCGGANSAVGPHYCPADRTIYLDETFFDELTTQLGATGGDVAEAYVISHEVGHHVQQELDILGDYSLFGNRLSENEISVRQELQADCYAGLWANSIKDLGVLEPDEIKEAMDAASAVGDDRIQSKVTGQISPETWTHGSSEQRVSWFVKGYDTGEFSSCDTSN